jgi:MoaA/NifB/PqqE/SkfB family radical SAM enzyme
VNNITARLYPYRQILAEMRQLYSMGVRILFFCGGETFLWQDGDLTLRDLVIEAKRMGFLIVNVVTNGTFPLDLPEADLILLSLDGDRERHNAVRGDTYDLIMANIARATADNICFYMAVNQINKDAVRDVCLLARDTKNVRAVSFNFHTPYPDTVHLALLREEKVACCKTISRMMDEGAPVFNLRAAFPYLIDNSFPTPCHQCVVMEDGRLSICGRCIDVPGLCQKCGYFFVAEYTLLFRGHIRIIADMLRTYLKYI